MILPILLISLLVLIGGGGCPCVDATPTLQKQRHMLVALHYGSDKYTEGPIIRELLIAAKRLRPEGLANWLCVANTESATHEIIVTDELRKWDRFSTGGAATAGDKNFRVSVPFSIFEVLQKMKTSGVDGGTLADLAAACPRELVDAAGDGAGPSYVMGDEEGKYSKLKEAVEIFAKEHLLKGSLLIKLQEAVEKKGFLIMGLGEELAHREGRPYIHDRNKWSILETALRLWTTPIFGADGEKPYFANHHLCIALERPMGKQYSEDEMLLLDTLVGELTATLGFCVTFHHRAAIDKNELETTLNAHMEFLQRLRAWKHLHNGVLRHIYSGVLLGKEEGHDLLAHFASAVRTADTAFDPTLAAFIFGTHKRQGAFMGYEEVVQELGKLRNSYPELAPSSVGLLSPSQSIMDQKRGLVEELGKEEDDGKEMFKALGQIFGGRPLA